MEEAEATYAEMPWNKLKRLRRSDGDIIAYLGEKVKKDFKLRVELLKLKREEPELNVTVTYGTTGAMLQLMNKLTEGF